MFHRTFRSDRIRRLLIGVALVVMFCAGKPAYANSDLRGVLGELAGDLKKLLDGRSEDSIAIGEFTGPANIQTSSGPGIVQTLSEELTKRKVTVKARATLGVKGTYSLAELPAENRDDARLGVKVLAVKVKAIVEDTFGNPLSDLSFERTIRGEATVVSMIGLTASLPTAGTERERDKHLRERLIDPKPVIQRTVIRSDAKSPYGIEIVIGKQPRAATDRDGLAFVSIQRGEVYAVRLINDSSLDAAVQLRIDGLSVFDFSELRHKDGEQKGEPLYTTLIVPAKSNALIPGWHRTNDKSDTFKVTAYADSAAATLKHTASIGTITAIFQAAWPEGATAPADEPGKRRGGTGDATGFGPRIDVKYEEVNRNLGVIRDTVSVRYAK